MCGISVTVSLFCDPREFAAGEDERRLLLNVYIREKEHKKEKRKKMVHGLRGGEVSSVMKCPQIVFGNHYRVRIDFACALQCRFV